MSPPPSSSTPPAPSASGPHEDGVPIHGKPSRPIDVLFHPLPRGIRTRGMPVLYPDHYAWYVLVSFLDVMLTVKLLLHLGAREVNTLAQFSIDLFGTWGLIGLKTLTMVVVVLICEYVGRRHRTLGRKIAVLAIVVSLLPVSAALTQVAVFTARGDLDWIAHPVNENTGFPIEP